MRLADRIALVKQRLAEPSPFLDPLAQHDVSSLHHARPESKTLSPPGAKSSGGEARPSTLAGLCIFCVRSRRRGGTRFGSSWDARHAASNFAQTLADGACAFKPLQAAYDELGASDIVFKVVERIGTQGRRLAAHEMEALLARRIAAHTRRHKRFICHKIIGVYSKQQINRGWRVWRDGARDARFGERDIAASRICKFARGLWARRFARRQAIIRREVEGAAGSFLEIEIGGSPVGRVIIELTSRPLGAAAEVRKQPA